jgi:hypothetical protein
MQYGMDVQRALRLFREPHAVIAHSQAGLGRLNIPKPLDVPFAAASETVERL